MTDSVTVLPVVLSGGSGTRLWPLSREKYPKQLLPLLGEDSLLQATLRRVDGVSDLHLLPPLVVCNEEYRFVIAEQLRQMQRSGTVLLEPAGRNTAPALAIAAHTVQQLSQDDPVLLVMPADHVILDTPAFQQAVRQGAAAATAGKVVTFGITPDAPETGYGYIQATGQADDLGARTIQRFVEKPDLATAQGYLDEGGYSWNSGLFMVRASVWLRALQLCRPDIAVACQQASLQGRSDGDFVRVDTAVFAACPSDSIDYAVMERIAASAKPAADLPAAVVIPLAAGWSDVGAWDALWDVLPKDAQGNVAQGDVLLHDTRNTLALSEGRLLACVGVDDLIVVETADAVLVAHKDKTQDVKKIVDRLKQTQRSEGQYHRKVFRPWGWYDSVDVGERFQVKRIQVKPGAALSLQMHHHRAEHWIVVSGTARVTVGEQVLLVSENQSTYIPLGTRHRLENPGKVPLEMIEVQSGSYLGEDDIVRFEDVYGR